MPAVNLTRQQLKSPNESSATLLGQLSNLTGGAPFVSPEALYYGRSYLIPLLLAAVGSTPLVARGASALVARAGKAAGALEIAACLALLLLSTAMLVDGSFNPFLYFRF